MGLTRITMLTTGHPQEFQRNQTPTALENLFRRGLTNRCFNDEKGGQVSWNQQGCHQEVLARMTQGIRGSNARLLWKHVSLDHTQTSIQSRAAQKCDAVFYVQGQASQTHSADLLKRTMSVVQAILSNFGAI